MRKFVKKNKAGLIIAFAVLLLITPFIWPFMLAVLWNVAGVAVPVGVAMVLLRFHDSRKGSDVEEEKGTGNGNSGRHIHLSEEKLAAKRADYWYASYGKKRLVRLAEDLEKEGFREVWIHPDGICKVKTQQGYRRRGTLAEYPAQYAGRIAEKLCADGIPACMHGKYLHLSLRKNRRAA